MVLLNSHSRGFYFNKSCKIHEQQDTNPACAHCASWQGFSASFEHAQFTKQKPILVNSLRHCLFWARETQDTQLMGQTKNEAKLQAPFNPLLSGMLKLASSTLITLLSLSSVILTRRCSWDEQHLAKRAMPLL